MRVTDVKIVPVNEDRLKGYVTVTIDDCFVIRDIKIIQGHDGLFVAMPSKKKKDGTYRDIAHPVNQETREIFEKQIFDAYEKMLSEQIKDSESD